MNKIDKFEEFRYRSKGYYLENELEILGNLFLVKNGGRNAFLFESSNFGNKAKILLKEIKIVYPEFKRVLEDLIAKRYLFFLGFIQSRQFGEEYEVWLGKVLGFDCPGDLVYNNLEITYAITYSLTNGIEKSQIFAQICRKNVGLSKLSFWNSFFENSKWKIKGKVKQIIPNALFRNKVEIKDIEWINKYRSEFLIWLNGNGLEFITETILKKGIIESFASFYDYILIEILADKNQLFSILYPLTFEEDQEFIKVRTYIWNKYLKEKDSKPISYLQEILNDNVVQSIIKRKKISFELITNKLEQTTSEFIKIRL